MALQKISLDIDADLYVRIKKDVFEKRTTMTKVIRKLLDDKYGKAREQVEKIE